MYSIIFFFSELLPRFIIKFSLHIDGTQRQILRKFEGNLMGTFRANYPSLVGTAAGVKPRPFVVPYPSYSTWTYLLSFLSELLPQFIFKFSLHIDSTQRHMMCKFEGILIGAIGVKYPSLVGTAAGVKNFVLPYPSYSTCSPPHISFLEFSVHSEGSQRQTPWKFEESLTVTFGAKCPSLVGIAARDLVVMLRPSYSTSTH